MEINITKLVRDYKKEEISLMDYSASAMELGPDVGKIIWENSKEATDYHFAQTEDQIETVKDWLKGFGAWEKEEIQAWDKVEVNALLLQFIAGDLREYLSAKSEGRKAFKQWNENHGGRIFQSGKSYFFYVGN